LRREWGIDCNPFTILSDAIFKERTYWFYWVSALPSIWAFWQIYQGLYHCTDCNYLFYIFVPDFLLFLSIFLAAG
jgi:hypothetical protein